MTAPGGVIATVYVRVLPEVQRFAQELRRSLRASSRELRRIDREIEPVNQALQRLARIATGIVPGVRLARTSLLALGGHAVIGGIVALSGAALTLSGALVTLPALGVAAASGIGALTVGLFGVDDALKKFTKGPEQFAEKLELLSGNAQRTLGVLEEFRGRITDFRNAVQDRLFAGLDDVLRGLLDTFLPRLATHFGNIADLVNAGAKDLAAFAQSSATLRDVNTVTSNIELAFVNLRSALIPAATAFRDVVTVGSSFLPMIATEVAHVVQRFSDWIIVMRATGQLQTFIQNGIDALKQLVAIAGNVGRALRAVLTAAQESGNGLLDTLEKLTDSVADFFESARGQEALRNFLTSAREAAEALAPVLVSLVDLLFNHVFPVLESIAKAVGPSVARFFSALGDAITQAAPGIKVFAEGFGQFIDGIIPALPAIAQLVSSIGTMVGILAGRLGPIIADIATAIANVLTPAFDALAAVFMFISPEVLKFIVVIGTVITVVATLITVIRGIGGLLSVFAGGLQLVTGGLGKTQGAASGLVGFLGGPWGIAIGLATTALGFLLSTADRTAGEVNALAESMINAADASEEAGDEWIRQKLEQDGVAATASKLSISINTLIDAYKGVPGAAEEVRQAIERNGHTADVSGLDVKKLNQVIRDGPQIYRDAAAAVDRKTEADRKSIPVGEALIGVMQGVNAALQINQDLLDRQQQQQLAALNSELAYRQQLTTTTAALAEGAHTLDINTAAGQDNLSTLADLAAAGQRHIADLKATNASTIEVTAAQTELENQLIQLVQPFFANRDAAHAFLVELGLLPRTIPIDIITNINSVTAAAQNLANTLARLPGTIFGGLAPGRAHGGPVPAGQWTVVGEQGPELVRFGRSARVFSNDESERMISDVSELDTLTSRGQNRFAGTGTTVAPTTTTSAPMVVQPEVDVRVYLGDQELTDLVRVEVNRRDQELRRLVTSGSGTRGTR